MAFKKTNEAVKRKSGRVGNIRYYVKAGNTYSRKSSRKVSTQYLAANDFELIQEVLMIAHSQRKRSAQLLLQPLLWL